MLCDLRSHEGTKVFQRRVASRLKTNKRSTPQQELELLRYIERLTRQGLPPTRPMIRRFASEIAKKELGVHWVDRYIKRHQVDLISRWTTGIDRARHQADSISKYPFYSSLLHEKISKYDVEARNMYNMDEKVSRM